MLCRDLVGGISDFLGSSLGGTIHNRNKRRHVRCDALKGIVGTKVLLQFQDGSLANKVHRGKASEMRYGHRVKDAVPKVWVARRLLLH